MTINMRTAILILILAATGFAQGVVKKPCSSTVTVNCTPQVNASGTFVPPAGSSYTLPAATPSAIGGVKVDVAGHDTAATLDEAGNLRIGATCPVGVTSVLCIPTQVQGDNSTKGATTEYVDVGLALKAPLFSPTFTGPVTAPSFVTNGTGTGYLDLQLGASPGNPASGNCRIYTDSGTGTVTALTSAGASCMPALSLPSVVVQTNQSNGYTAGTQDFTGAAHTLPAKSGLAASKPSTCSVGEVYFATDASVGQNLYYCTATNTWNQQSGGTSAATAQKLVDGSAADAVIVAADSGTITDQVTITNSNSTNHTVSVGASGSDSNISLKLLPKGVGTVIVPTPTVSSADGLSLGAACPAGHNSSLCINGPADGGGIFYDGVRIYKNGAFSWGSYGGTIFAASGFSAGSSSPGNGGGAALGAYGLTIGADLGLGRTSAGVFEINKGSAGGAAAADIRDLKLRHGIWSGTAPTITSGFGTSPSIAGSDSAGRITVGSGGTELTGVITFGTAFAIAPACVAGDETTLLQVRASATTTTLTLASATAWGAADKLTWICQGY